MASSIAPLGEKQNSHSFCLMDHFYGKNGKHLQVVLLMPDLFSWFSLSLMNSDMKHINFLGIQISQSSFLPNFLNELLL